MNLEAVENLESVAHAAGLFITLAVITVSDMFFRKADNKVLLYALVYAVIIQVLRHGSGGFINSISGIFTGLAIMIPFYLLGGIGAGDVKFTATVGAFTSWLFMLYAIFLTSVAGAVIALGVLIKRRNIIKNIKETATLNRKERIEEIQNPESEKTIPYCLAITIGTIWAVFEFYKKTGQAPWG
jgi:prepilin peptidase CpaA